MGLVSRGLSLSRFSSFEQGPKHWTLWSIRHIAEKIKSYTLFATHFHELTVLAHQIPSVKNLQATAIADANKITLLYKVIDGICERSFGIHVAELAHFPQSVIDMAKRKAAELEAFETDAEALSSQAAKKTKWSSEVIEKGLTNVSKFMDDLSARFTDLDNMTDAQIEASAEQLKSEYQIVFEENEWIKDELIGR